jgi:threonine synthase
MFVTCHDCDKKQEFNIIEWRCSCGGAWEPLLSTPFDPERINIKTTSIWRYGQFLGLDIQQPLKHMGVGWMPLVPIKINGREVYLKLEFLSPSGSFKDRGVNAMVNQLVHMGVKSVVEDSSGNAGASLAAHAARFGIPAQIYVPSYASPAKLHQIEVYGVEVIPVPGPRKAAEEAAQASVNETKAYASHAYNPAYLAGQVTAAWELWEQLGRKSPDWIILPVAQGGQFLGYWMGFSILRKAGLIGALPRLVAVQSAQVAPIFDAWSQGMEDIPAVEPKGPTLAEGVAIPKPARGKRLLQALRESEGRVVICKEQEILDAQQNLAHIGYFVEPTSALAFAGYKQMLDNIGDEECVVLPLTGSGLKGIPTDEVEL